MSDSVESAQNASPSNQRLLSNDSSFQRQVERLQNIHLPEIRIEIHSTSSDLNIPGNLETRMPSNFSSFINESHPEAGRQTDSRAWRMNFSNVFQGVRPLVQRAQSINNFRPWISNSSFSYRPLINEDNEIRSEPIPHNHSPNLGAINSNYLSVNVEEIGNINDRRPPTNDRISSSGRPILDRVASLTRNDPPNLFAPDISQRSRRHAGNTEDEEGGAVAEVFAQVPEARRAFIVLARYIPFICILLAKSVYDNFTEIFDLSALSIIFIHANSIVREQGMRHAQRQIAVLMRELLYIVLIIFFRYFYSDENTFLGLLLINKLPSSISLGQLLFSVAVTDLLLKLITMVIKIFVIMLSPDIIKYKRRGRVFVLIESLSQLYRALAPIQPWLTFLIDSYTGVRKILGVVFSAAYMVSKGFDLVERAKLCKKAFVGFFKKVNYGKVPTKEQIQTVGGQCPICHENFNTPVILECNHIFCELCVGTWFSKQQTCPLCRAKVAEDPSWQDGATSFFLQMY